MILRIALLLLACTFALLVTATILLWLAIPVLPDVVTQLGLVSLFCVFVLLLITGFYLIAKHLLLAVMAYFSASQRGQRRLLFIQIKQQQLKQLFYCRALRIHHDTDLQRQQLLCLNQRKHLKALSKAIDHDLNALKIHLPKTTIKQLQQQNRYYHQQQDSTALLQLQQKISTYTHHDA